MPSAPRLADVDPDVGMDKKTYKKQLYEAQLGMVQIQDAIGAARLPIAIVMEGWDAAGKGGAIKRMIDRIDPRLYDIHPTAAPTQEELDHNYLWRFWQRLPARGSMAIFDRSWYGRVLVERIEGFATKDEWQRAYREINDFERLLVDDHHLVLKFFFHISKDEQKKRFEARRTDPMKSWKLTEEDYRNRKKWDAYAQATDDMFAETHTEHAPWHIIPGNSKHYARVTFIQTVVDAIRKRVAGYQDP